MKHRFKFSLLLLMVFSIVSGIFSGCAPSGTTEASQPEPQTSQAAPQSGGDAGDGSDETITLVDDRGIEVTFPKDPQRIVISSILPLTSVYCLYRGGTDNLVGIPAAAMSAAEHSYLAKVYPDVLKLETDFSAGGEINIEEVMKLNPDVVFYRANEEAEGDMYQRAGIPAVAFSTSKFGTDTIATFAGWIELLDQIFGGGEQTQGIVDYGHDVLKLLRERTAALTDEQRLTGIIFTGYSGNQLLAAGGDIFAEFYLTEGGGSNVATELSGSKPVNMEQIYEWNPEVIFINNFCPYLPEDIYNNAIEGYDWSNVDAVKNKRVYKYPLGMYRWYPPAGDAPLSLLWVAKQMHPYLFEDIDMDQTVKDYYAKFYGYNVTDEDLKDIYNPPREAAYY